ncbi:MAG: glycosyl hydrolase family 18 protein [Bacteroidota bacterium]
MKTIQYLMLCLCIGVIATGCKKGQEADVDENFHPRIFDNGGVFTVPSRIINAGQSAIYSGLTFSPKPVEKTKISWKVNGTEVSTDTAYTFTPAGGGEFEIKVEATYNGQTSTRISKVLVSPATYTPKAAPFVNMMYLSENGVSANVDWTKVTHLAFSGARVLPSGGIDFSKGNQNQNIDELVARGHIAGVPVLLGITGTLSGIDGWSLYNSVDFGTVIKDAAKRAVLVQTLAAYVVARKLDGIDIMMTDLSNDSYDLSAAHAQAVGPFISELKAVLPAKSLVTATVTVNYMHWEYTSLLSADWVNVHAFENGAIGPGTPPAQQSPFNFMVDAATIWVNKGYPKTKIVLGIPAFGIRYLELDASGNNLSWGSYNYVSFKDILAADATAAQKEYTASLGKGVYFNGVPLVTQKANYIKTNGFKGAYLWAGDYDATGTNSLMGTLSGILK